jgi:hypothetical protein
MMALLVAAAFFTGCATQTTCDARGETETCELHHQLMRSVTVHNPNLKTWPSQEYLQARMRGFLHSRPFVLPKECKRAVVFICDECQQAENVWQMQHQGEK